MGEDADRAAGEVIYSSDGLPPVAAAAPKVPTAKEGDGDDMNVLDAGTVDANGTTAFEVFSGKVYPVVASSNNYTNNANTSMKSETTSQRLARLQQEVAELEQDLTSSGTIDSAEEDGRAGFMELVSSLKTRIGAQAGVAASSKNQEEMTRSIQQHLKEWEANKSKDGNGAKDSEAGVVYELYGGVGMMPSTATSSAPSWEERLLQVEGLVGAAGGGDNTSSNSSSNNQNQSLLGRLEEMEDFLQRLDPKALEQASARAKVIRSDLEAASKARNKLASAATFRKEDAQTISSLHDQMTQLEGLSGHLPALVARLQQLATMHASSSSFSVRLTQNEKQVVQLQTVLKQLDESVAKVEAGMVENVTTIEKNMQQLDERMKQL